ncbi:hypothetical protein DFR86_00980 [Acidianus sulfidivorans JP7]|uniref:Uncharacterized protein n=1 Tax=Acidianus sulfidivorans JP7 TaxID=619593 RepID=A0A2U9IJU0_9CREN|nr:hypothetical protein [Acidianus sulfidivorans]AWR96255.1 hypothetical protein DFR86_00980 [Acidianus sulfidivorans JP7]
MKFSESEPDIVIISGDGNTDLDNIERTLEAKKEKYCKIRYNIPGRSLASIKSKMEIQKEEKNNTGTVGIARYIKTESGKKFFHDKYLVLIDREHLKNGFEDLVDSFTKYGISVYEIKNLSSDVCKIRISINNVRDILVYVVIMGIHCCLEDEIIEYIKNKYNYNLKVEERTGSGCCRYYKDILKSILKNKLKVKKIYEVKGAINYIFNKIKIIFDDIIGTLDKSTNIGK